ncbi:MAG TPA: chemotaxis protein CheX [Polyangiaceae bacterium]|nr:chemotaxis protein CheX [Polyangiaceae bacterium]
MNVTTRPEDAQALAEALTTHCCSELLSDFGFEPVWLAPEHAVPDGVSFCSVVGFSGQKLRGSIIMSSSGRAANELSSHIPGPIRDVIGEIANQLGGRLKNKFLLYGVDLYMTLPVVLRGEHFAPMPRIELRPIGFSIGSGSMWVWVDTECFDGFEMAVRPNPAEAPMAEGEALLF